MLPMACPRRLAEVWADAWVESGGCLERRTDDSRGGTDSSTALCETRGSVRSVERHDQANAVITEAACQSLHHGEDMWPVCFRSQDSADGQRFVCAHNFVGGPLHTSRHAVRVRGWPAAVASDDVLKEENKQIRARIRELETEREILRRVAKYFAGETNWWAVCIR